METDRGLFVDGKQRSVAPDARRPGLYFFARDVLLDLVVIIVHLERSETKLAHIDRLNRIRPVTFATLKPFNVTHLLSITYVIHFRWVKHFSIPYCLYQVRRLSVSSQSRNVRFLPK